MRAKPIRSRQSSTRQQAFTLVEVLVAMTILAFTIPALMAVMISQTDGAGRLRDKTIAYWVAENTATRLRVENRLTGAAPNREQRDTVEMAGVEWRVSTDIEPTEAGLIEYTISVGADADSTLISIVTYLGRP